MSTRPEARRATPRASNWFLPLLIVVAVAVAVFVIGGGMIKHGIARANVGVRAYEARNKLATAAADAIHRATSSEKNAMLAGNQADLDDYSSGWVTAVDHLKEDITGLKQSARSPADTTAIAEIDAALQAYVKSGEAMYQLKIHHETDEAIAMSNAAAQQARERVINLVRDQVDDSNDEVLLYQGKIDRLIIIAIAGSCCMAVMVGWIGLRSLLLSFTPRRRRLRRSRRS